MRSLVVFIMTLLLLLVVFAVHDFMTYEFPDQRPPCPIEDFRCPR